MTAFQFFWKFSCAWLSWITTFFAWTYFCRFGK